MSGVGRSLNPFLTDHEKKGYIFYYVQNEMKAIKSLLWTRLDKTNIILAGFHIFYYCYSI